MLSEAVYLPTPSTKIHAELLRLSVLTSPPAAYLYFLLVVAAPPSSSTIILLPYYYHTTIVLPRRTMLATSYGRMGLGGVRPTIYSCWGVGDLSVDLRPTPAGEWGDRGSLTDMYGCALGACQARFPTLVHEPCPHLHVVRPLLIAIAGLAVK
jgi:hypothetical protein